jgi:hypothetical protein
MLSQHKRARLQELDSELNTLQKQADDLRRQKRQTRKARQKQNKRKHLHEAVMLLVLAQGNNDGGVLAHYDKQKLSTFDMSERQSMVERVQKKYNAMVIEEKEKLLKQDGPHANSEENRLASKFLRDYQLYKWVAQANTQSVIAPVTRVVADEASKLKCFAHGKDVTPKRKHQKQWLRRFRTRWNMSLGSFAVREFVSEEEGKSKVKHGLHKDANCIPSESHSFGHDPTKTRTQKHLVDPISGPSVWFSHCTRSNKCPRFGARIRDFL